MAHEIRKSKGTFKVFVFFKQLFPFAIGGRFKTKVVTPLRLHVARGKEANEWIFFFQLYEVN